MTAVVTEDAPGGLEARRAKFEEWAAVALEDTTADAIAGYRSPVEEDAYLVPHSDIGSVTLTSMWLAWFAALDGVEIRLPDEEPGYMYWAPDVVDAIEAAGVRTKP